MEQLSNVIHEFKNTFCIPSSSNPSANVEPRKIEVTPDAEPVSFRIRNYPLHSVHYFKRIWKFS